MAPQAQGQVQGQGRPLRCHFLLAGCLDKRELEASLRTRHRERVLALVPALVLVLLLVLG